MIFLYSW